MVECRYFGGKIREVMLFTDDLADYAIKRLEGYLAHKWGVESSLPNSHPFKSTATLWWHPDHCEYWKTQFRW